MQTKIYDINKKGVGEIELNEEIFAATAKDGLLYDSVIRQLANKRLGCAKVKGRGEVKCSNKKPYRQKGTGRARHGTYASPIFVGGGVTFGPQPRSYEIKMNQKTRRKALRAALSVKFKEGKVTVIDKIEMKAPKTSEIKKILDKFDVKNAVLVVDKRNDALEKSVRNIRNVKLLAHDWLNVYDILKYEHLIFTAPAIKSVQEVLKA